MAHLVEQMAYVGATPWHGLGNRLTQKQPLEVWQREAGMNWQIQESPVHFKADTIGNLGTIHSFPEQKVLYRSDTKAPLSVVSNCYQVVQPREVLEFYRDLTEVSGYELETAGVLKGGRKFWALARTGQTTVLKGNDQVNGYLLLATSCDGTLATTATPTTVRSLQQHPDHRPGRQQPRHQGAAQHAPQAMKKQLGIAVSQWDEFMYRMRALAERKVQWHEAMGFFMNVLCETSPTGALPEQLPNERALRKVQELYEGHGRGSQLDSARGTAWGLLNAVTEFVDHERRARSNEYRMDSCLVRPGRADQATCPRCRAAARRLTLTYLTPRARPALCWSGVFMSAGEYHESNVIERKHPQETPCPAPGQHQGAAARGLAADP